MMSLPTWQSCATWAQRHEEVPAADAGHATAARRAAVDRDELADDVVVADLDARRRAVVLQVLRRKADRHEGRDLVVVPDLGVSPSITVEAPTRLSRPSRTSGPMTTCGPTMVPAPMTASGWTVADAWIVATSVTTARRSSISVTTWSSTMARALTRSMGRRPAEALDLEPHPVAGRDLPAELRLVDAVQPHVRVRG